MPTAKATARHDILWAPSPGPQKALIDCPLPEIFYGGARGGGKTSGIIGKWALKQHYYGKHVNCLFLRKAMPASDDVIEYSKEVYYPLGAEFNETRAQWRFKNGARIRFRHLENIQDADSYQGQNVTDVAVEEAGLYNDPKPIDRLHGILRSATGIPTQMILTGNPGGPGQLWLKQRYIDPAPMGMKVLTRELPNGATHKYVYIPSRVSDNRFLMRTNYVNQLYLVGNAQLVKAWLEGDWNAIEGAFFDTFSTFRHICKPFEIPKHWLRFRAMDWGYAEPFSVGWYAVASEETPLHDDVVLPKGALVKYREWYGAKEGKPNVGIRMNDDVLGKEISARELGETISYGVIDPAAFAQRGGPSNAETIMQAGKIAFQPADNTRTGPRGHVVGWSLVRHRLDGIDASRPMVVFFDTCKDTIRTLPSMQHHRDKAEDMDDTAEDHACFAAGTMIKGRGLVEDCGQRTRCDTEVVRVSFEDGFEVVCTPDHLFLGDDGQWHQAKNLRWQYVLSATPSKSFKVSGITAAVFTSSARVCDFIVKCGNTMTAQYPLAFMSTIRMKTGLTTTGQISNYLPAVSTSGFTASSDRLRRLARVRSMLPPSGIAVQPEGNGIATTGIATAQSRWQSVLQRLARFAGSLMRQAASASVNHAFATKTVRRRLCVRVDRLSEKQDVFCLATKAAFVELENGVIASNCDELRYACASRPWIKPSPTAMPPLTTLKDVTMNRLWKARPTQGGRI